MRENHHRLVYQVDSKYNGMTIKEILREEFSMSTRLLKSIKNNGYILLNHKEIKWYKTAWEGDIILVDMGEEETDAAPVDIPINIVYEDHDILLINKQPNLVAHPTKGHVYDTLANAIAHHWYQDNISCKIRFINRLDRDTSGLILIGKNKFAHQHIQGQMEKNSVKKVYWAVVEGILNNKEGTIHAPIRRANEDDIIRRVMEGGQDSITHYKVIEEYKNASLVELHLETGRTHQIRVHMKYIGHPLIGDSLYNANVSEYINRQALHARKLEFILPRTKEKKAFYAELPEDIKTLKNQLSNL